MHPVLFIHSETHLKYIVLNSLKKDIIAYPLTSINNNIISNRIGIIWNNNFDHIPIGEEILKINKFKFKWFKKEFYDIFSKLDNLTIDLLSCDLNDNDLKNEIKILEMNLNKITINYSLNKNEMLIGNYNTENNNESIKHIYFTDYINNWFYDLNINNNAFILNDGIVITSKSNSIMNYNQSTTNIICVSSGIDFTAFVHENGTVYTYGNNCVGQLGLGSLKGSEHVQRVLNLFDIEIIRCGGQHSLALSKNGVVYGFGNNTSGQLMNDTLDIITKPKKIMKDAKMISCGYAHSAILLSNCDVHIFGNNSHKQSNKIITNAKSVSCGSHHTAILLNNNNIVTFGYGIYGQLGHGNTLTMETPTIIKKNNGIAVSCGEFHTAILLENSNVVMFGKIQNEIILKPKILLYNNIVDISCEYNDTNMLLSNGDVMNDKEMIKIKNVSSLKNGNVILTTHQFRKSKILTSLLEENTNSYVKMNGIMINKLKIKNNHMFGFKNKFIRVI